MTIIGLVFVLVLLGVGLWLFNNYVTAIDARIKTLINIVVIVIAFLFVLHAFGLLGALRQPVPRL